jgi:AbrB family looped-hinge helix DNA binding protein
MKGKIEESVPEFYGAVVVGERGQIVIPAKARRDMDITPGEKLIILGGPQGNMLMMAKAESMLQLLNKVMGHASQFERMLQADDKPPK